MDWKKKNGNPEDNITKLNVKAITVRKIIIESKQ